MYCIRLVFTPYSFSEYNERSLIKHDLYFIGKSKMQRYALQKYGLCPYKKSAHCIRFKKSMQRVAMCLHTEWHFLRVTVGNAFFKAKRTQLRIFVLL